MDAFAGLQVNHLELKLYNVDLTITNPLSKLSFKSLSTNSLALLYFIGSVHTLEFDI